MSDQKLHFHGSDLEKIQQVYGVPKEEITSFSSNVNPLGISPKVKQLLAERIDVISSYPDREYTSLRKCISKYTDAEPDHIIVGNGTSELISLFIKVLQPKKSLIIGPTYSEYEREVTLGGGNSLYFPLKEVENFKLNLSALCSAFNESLDLLVVCNPNNPTSSSISCKDMRTILDTCKQYGIMVLVDETYIEFVTEIKKITAVSLARHYNNIVILRGVSKFYAAPGLRLGYAITGNQDLLKEVNILKNPWTINSLAALAGEIMFQDTDYIQQTKQLIGAERRRIYEYLKTKDTIQVYEPEANFLLVRIKKAGITSGDVFERAIMHKIMIRDCSTFPFLNDQYIRFCILKPKQNDQLLECIGGIL